MFRQSGVDAAKAAVVCFAVLFANGLPAIPFSSAAARVTQKTVERPYWVTGKTATELVRYMVRHPTRGDRGGAWANIRPSYNLNVATRTSGKARACRVRSVNLHITFTMTIPRGRTERAMSPRTRSRWRSFKKFTRAHEIQHRNIYLRCARKFAAKARRMAPAASCRAHKARIRSTMFAAMRACEPKHRAFDRREAKRLKRHPLLKGGD